jgi:hypothetical protein
MKIAVVLLAAAALGAAPHAARAEVCSGITNETVTVDIRKDDWTAAAVRIRPGDIVIVHASGVVKLAHTLLGEIGPKGTANGSGRLDMKVFTESKVDTAPVVPVGDRWVGSFREPVTVRFRVNSERFQENAGAYKVSVIVVPAGALPPAVKFEAD